MNDQDCEELKRDIETMENLLQGLSKEIHSIARAFPRTSLGEIDADGHRHYHESLIRSAQAQEKFWSELRQDLMRKGLTVVIVVILGLMVTGLGVEFKAFLAKLGAK